MRSLPPQQKMWLAFADSYEEVEIVCRGVSGHVFKPGHKPEQPYTVVDCDGHEYIVGLANLHHSPLEASIEMAQLAKKHGVKLESNPSDPDDDDPPDSSPGDDDDEDDDE